MEVIALNHRIMGSGYPVILLHGLFGSLENLGTIAKELSQKYEVHALDARNHGRSPHCEKMSYPLMAQDVLHYMDEHSIDVAHVLGHSMGGKTGMELALQVPDRVSKLVVADIAPVTYEDKHSDIIRGMSRIDLSILKSRIEAQGVLEEFIQEPAILSFILKNLVKAPSGNFAWRMNFQAIKNHYGEIRAGLKAGRRFSGETLFIGGSLSDYIKPEHESLISALFSNIQYKEIDGAGHWLHVEKQSTFLRLVEKFYAQ